MVNLDNGRLGLLNRLALAFFLVAFWRKFESFCVRQNSENWVDIALGGRIIGPKEDLVTDNAGDLACSDYSRRREPFILFPSILFSFLLSSA